MDPGMIFDHVTAVILGTALAATCGLRAFLPLLGIGALGAMGKLELAESFEWMSSPVALACFGTAVVFEVAADKFPGVDHVLDVAGTVVKPVAAAIASASMVTDVDPLLGVVLGLIVGGTLAEAVHLRTRHNAGRTVTGVPRAYACGSCKEPAPKGTRTTAGPPRPAQAASRPPSSGLLCGS